MTGRPLIDLRKSAGVFEPVPEGAAGAAAAEAAAASLIIGFEVFGRVSQSDFFFPFKKKIQP